MSYLSWWLNSLDEAQDDNEPGEEETQRQLPDWFTHVLGIYSGRLLYHSLAANEIDIEDLTLVVSWDQQFLNSFNKVLFSEPLAIIL